MPKIESLSSDYGRDKIHAISERYTRMWLEARSDIPRAHSWDHTKMVAQLAIEVGKKLEASKNELDAIYIAALGHDAIQPGLIPEEKEGKGLYVLPDEKTRGGNLKQRMSEEWGYNPGGEEGVESAKATRYVISSAHFREEAKFLDDEMINRITQSIAGHGVRIGQGGVFEKESQRKDFKDWDVIAKSLYIADKISNQEPAIVFALCNFTPKKENNERPLSSIDRFDREKILNFLKKWFEKRAHLLDNKEVAPLLTEIDPDITQKIGLLKEFVDEYEF